MADTQKGLNMNNHTAAPVFFVGAGPGDPELITVKGKNIVSQSEVILYAGSLVSEEILQYAPSGAAFHNTAGMKLDEQLSVMAEAVEAGKQVVRLHTGDPSIYGAIYEQMKGLDRLGIGYRVVPGVSSAFAAAAALAVELTIPESTQTIILTRLSGRTKVPEAEALASLAAHRSSLMIFLSAGMVDRVVAELIASGYTPDTPVAVAYRVSWPDEIILHGTLETIAAQMLDAEITHHALIVVTPSLALKSVETMEVSHLYGAAQDLPARKKEIAIVTLTRNGTETGRTLLDKLPGSVLFAPERFVAALDDERVIPSITSVRQTLQTAFQEYSGVVAMMASGIVVRELAPVIGSKHTDAAVVVVDERGEYAISLMGGHKGGANALAGIVADALGGEAVITTASDVQGLPALDLLPRTYGWQLANPQVLTPVSAAMVNGEQFGVYQDCGAEDWLPGSLPDNFQKFAALEEMLAQVPVGVCVTYQAAAPLCAQAKVRALVFHPACLHVGVGCNRGTPEEEIWQAVEDTFSRFGLALESIASFATIEAKADEVGLLAAAQNRQFPLNIYTAEALSQVPDIPNPAAYVRETVGAPGVAEPAAMLAAGASTLLVEKQKFANVTVAVALQARAS